MTTTSDTTTPEHNQPPATNTDTPPPSSPTAPAASAPTSPSHQGAAQNPSLTTPSALPKEPAIASDTTAKPEGYQTSQVKPTSSDEIDYRIGGNDMQFVDIILDPGECVIAEMGAMMYKDQYIEIHHQLPEEKAAAGFIGGLKMKMSSENSFLDYFVSIAKKSQQHVAFAAPYPGQILPLDLGALGGEVQCHPHGFMCGARGVVVGNGFSKRVALDLYGANGYVMQKLTGDGLVFIHAGGAMTQRTLRQGEKISVDIGCLVAYQKGVEISVKSLRGNGNMVYNTGKTISHAFLVGPGKVWLQSMPYHRLVSNIKDTLDKTKTKKEQKAEKKVKKL